MEEHGNAASPKDVFTSVLEITPQRQSTATTIISPPKRVEINYTHKALIALTSFVLLLVIIALEIIGAAKAGEGQKVIASKQVAWCSPIFQPFGLAVQIGCEFHQATQDSNRGIGCVSLPAKMQSGWLKSTAILLPAALVLQVADLVIMMKFHSTEEKSKSKWRGIKMQRPWFTVRSDHFLF